MNIASLFIERPIATFLTMLGILIFGIIGYRQLPVSDLPSVDFPTINVIASLPGASPETMASSVATPLEKQFSTIAGIDSMSSSSILGTASITLQFNLSRDIDSAAQDVQAAISAAQQQLPPDMPAPPSYFKVNPADSPILFLALTSATLPLTTLNEYGEIQLAQQISMVKDVAQVIVFGAQKYAIRIQLDPNELVSKGIGVDEIVAAARKENVNLPTGTLYGRYRTYNIQASGQLFRATQYNQQIVAYRNGQPVRLKEVGTAIEGVQYDKTAAWFGSADKMQRSLVLAIQRQPGTNTVSVTSAIRKLLPKLTRQLPASVSMEVMYDRSVSIKASVEDVQFTLYLTLCLVILVIFLFLRNLRATIIPSLSLPMSIVGTFAVMTLLGYSLNNLTLLALTLCVGFVVDDAIVVMENIVRHMEMGKKPFQAAVDGSKEIGFTIISMTISLAAVFIPILFMSGILGRLFKEFAVTIAVAILISGFVSLSLAPMLASRILKSGPEKKRGRAYQISEKFFDGLLRFYSGGLRWSLRHKSVILVFSIIILIATVYLFQVIPKGFIPTEDTGRLFSVTEGAEGITFEEMIQNQLEVAKIVQRHPGVRAFMSSIGGGGRNFIANQNQGRIMIFLKDRNLRKQSAEQILHELRPRVMQFPGILVFMQVPPTIVIGGRMAKSLYQYSLYGTDMEELYRHAPVIEKRMRELPGLIDVTSDLQLKNPQINIQIDRDKAVTYGLSAGQIEDALYTAYSSRQISTIYTPTNQYAVIIEIKPEFQAAPERLSLLYIRSSSGQLVPLHAVTQISTTTGPLTINHTGQIPSVTISFNLRPGTSLSEAFTQIEKVSKEILPSTISTAFQGAAQAYESSLRGLGFLLVISILLIYIVLGILYESLIHPITILTALPFAGFGALVTLFAFGMDLNIYAFVGVILLVGLVKKNGIMMVDFAIEAQKAPQMTAEKAIYDACVIRFRPIMMTTMAALMGTLPIALGVGTGAESRRPLGLAVVGGLVFSQFLTLYVTPVFYLYFDKLQGLLQRRRKKKLLSVTENDILLNQQTIQPQKSEE